MLDRRRVAELVEDADVVVHLAFMIMGGAKQSRRVNLEGSRNVFVAAAEAGVETARLCLLGRCVRLPQGQPAAAHRGCAGAWHRRALLLRAEGGGGGDARGRRSTGSRTAAYVFRPCIVAGPQAPLLIDSLPYTQISERLPGPVLSLLDGVPILKPVLPDPGVPFQLVHHDDVATAMRAAVLGRGKPGVYNLAGAGELTVKLLADELGWYSIPVPELAVDVVAEMIGRLGFLPAQAQWIAAFREPVIMSTSKARRELGWRPKHDAAETLRETVAAARMERLIR